MKKRSNYKVLSGVGKRWKVKYFDSFFDAIKYWKSFVKLKGSGFATMFDFKEGCYQKIVVKNGKHLIGHLIYFKMNNKLDQRSNLQHDWDEYNSNIYDFF